MLYDKVKNIFRELKSIYYISVYGYNKNSVIIHVVNPLDGVEEVEFPREFAENMARIYRTESEGIENKVDEEK